MRCLPKHHSECYTTHSDSIVAGVPTSSVILALASASTGIAETIGREEDAVGVQPVAEALVLSSEMADCADTSADDLLDSTIA